MMWGRGSAIESQTIGALPPDRLEALISTYNVVLASLARLSIAGLEDGPVQVK